MNSNNNFPHHVKPSAGYGDSYDGSIQDHPASSVPATVSILPFAAAAASAAGAVTTSSSSMYADFIAAASTSHSSSDDDEDDGNDSYGMPWDQPDWVPKTKSGKQKTPNMIRNELQRYIDACKADGSSTQTRIVERMGVNSNSFRKFMDPKTYKNQWSATSNGTYWAAAKLLAQRAHEKELDKLRGGGKRKSSTAASGNGAAKKKAKTTGEDAQRKKSGAEMKKEALDLIRRINAVEGVRQGVVYDTCPQVAKKIKEFLQHDGMTKKYLCVALGDINSNSLQKFLSAKGQDGCGNVAYRAGYEFFEKLRVLEGKGKSAARKANELKHPDGFSLEKARAGKYKWLPPQGPNDW